MTLLHSGDGHATPAGLLERVVDTVSYLRIAGRREADPALEWLSCAELVTDRDRLADVVRSTAAGRGTDREDLAMSLFVQAYAFRIASAAVGGWLANGAQPDSTTFDVRPANTAIALGRHRPNALALQHVKLSRDDVWTVTLDHHLIPLIEAAHDALRDGPQRIARPLLWSNVAAGCASSFGAFHGNVAAGERAAVRSAAELFWQHGPQELRDAGRFVEFRGDAPEPGWFFERNACCLWYRIPPADPAAAPFKCEDCSLWTPAERTARYREATRLEAGS